MKMDIALLFLFVLIGILAGAIFYSSIDKTLSRPYVPLIQKLDESLTIQRDLQMKLNYAAVQMSRMNERLKTEQVGSHDF